MATTIVLTGGGSGGHITPVLAVADELKKAQPDARLIYIGQTGDSLSDIPAQHPSIDAVHTVRAGKLRRYHGEGLKQLLDIPTTLKNLRDVIYVGVGLFQSFWLLRRLHPDVIFIKGGFVGVPVGLAAAVLRQPYVTHDSDALPGLANRLIARWAALHAVGQPKEVYAYPPAKTITVGVPVQAQYQAVTPVLQAQYRKELSLPTDALVLCVAGGGLGAQRINQAVLANAVSLLKDWPDLHIVHQAGRQHEVMVQKTYDELLPQDRKRVIVKGFVTDMYRLSGAADLVISRAGATNMAEFATQGKACIIIPNPVLTGGHQLKNAAVLADKQAIVVVNETSLTNSAPALATEINRLLGDAGARSMLGNKLQALAHPAAAKELAMVLLNQIHLRK